MNLQYPVLEAMMTYKEAWGKSWLEKRLEDSRTTSTVVQHEMVIDSATRISDYWWDVCQAVDTFLN